MLKKIEKNQEAPGLAPKPNVFYISLSAEIAKLFFSTFRLNRLVYQELNENILMLLKVRQK